MGDLHDRTAIRVISGSMHLCCSSGKDWKSQACIIENTLILVRLATMSSATTKGLVDPAVFEHLQSKIDEDSTLRQKVRDVTQILERQR